MPQTGWLKGTVMPAAPREGWPAHRMPRFIYTMEKTIFFFNCNMKQSFHLDSAHFCNNNYNNDWFLYSTFLVWDTTQSALQCIITPVTGFNINPALIVHHLNKRQIRFASYRVPIHTPGWRAAMWIKRLAEGHKVPGIDGNWTRNPLIHSQGFNLIYHSTSTDSIKTLEFLTCLEKLEVHADYRGQHPRIAHHTTDWKSITWLYFQIQ